MRRPARRHTAPSPYSELSPVGSWFTDPVNGLAAAVNVNSLAVLQPAWPSPPRSAGAIHGHHPPDPTAVPPHVGLLRGHGSLVNYQLPWVTLGLTAQYITATPLTVARLHQASYVRVPGRGPGGFKHPAGAVEWEQALHAAVGATPHGTTDVIVARKLDRVPRCTHCLATVMIPCIHGAGNLHGRILALLEQPNKVCIYDTESRYGGI